MNLEEQDNPVPAPRTWPGYVLGGYALICGGLAIHSARFYPQGWAVLSRPALGGVGVMAGLMLLLRDAWWKPLLQFWLLAQAAVLIVDPSGPLTWQPGLHIVCMRFGSRLFSGPVLLTFTGCGVNFGALLLLVLVWVVLAKKWYPVGAGRWLDRLAGFFEIVFLAAVVAGGVYAGLRWAKPLFDQDALLVIDSPPPGAQVYLKDKLLGSTPLAVTPQKLVQWGLSKPGAGNKCILSPSPLGNGLVLQGASATGELLFQPPAWLAADYVTMPTPWGSRGLTPIRNYNASNYWSVPLLSRKQPGLVLDQPVIEPSECKPGGRITIAVRMWRNAADPRVPASPPAEPALSARLSVLFWRPNNFSAGSSATTNLALPPAWTNLAVGETVSNVLTLPAPFMPGAYTVRLSCAMLAAWPPFGFCFRAKLLIRPVERQITASRAALCRHSRLRQSIMTAAGPGPPGWPSGPPRMRRLEGLPHFAKKIALSP